MPILMREFAFDNFTYQTILPKQFTLNKNRLVKLMTCLLIFQNYMISLSSKELPFLSLNLLKER